MMVLLRIAVLRLKESQSFDFLFMIKSFIYKVGNDLF